MRGHATFWGPRLPRWWRRGLFAAAWPIGGGLHWGTRLDEEDAMEPIENERLNGHQGKFQLYTFYITLGIRTAYLLV